MSTRGAARFWIAWSSLPLLVLVLYLPVIPDLVEDWTYDADSEHGMLVPIIFAWLLWRKRRELSQARVRVSWWGLAGMAVTLLVYLASYLGHVAVLARASFVFLLYFLVVFTLGTEFERRLRFPMFFLLFMVPVPASIRGLVAFPLQLLASRVSAAILDGVGIVVLREGNVLHLTNTSLEVAAACSGIRSMVSYVMLGVLFSYLSRNRLMVTATLLALSVPIALAANIARVVGSGLLAEWFGPQTAEGFLHEVSGLVMFAVGFVIFLGLNGLLNRWFGSEPETPKETEKECAASGVFRGQGSGIEQPRMGFTLVASLVLLLGITTVQLLAHRARVEIVDPRLSNLPFEIGDWRGATTRFAEEERINRILGVDVSFLRVYSRGDDAVVLYVGYYGTEKGGRSSHDPESCYAGAGWVIDHRGLTQLTPKGGTSPVSVNRLVARSGEWKEEILHWYQVAGDRVVCGGITLNLLRFWRGILENRNDGAFVRVTARVDASQPDRALELVKEFSAELLPLFPVYWPLEAEASSK